MCYRVSMSSENVDEDPERKVVRARTSELFIKPSVGEWQNVGEERAIELASAYSNELRRAILKLLDKYGPMRKYKVTELINQEMGADYRDVTVQYHLGILEKAGLIGTIPGEGKRAKIVYRAGNIQIRWCEFEKPKKLPRMPAEDEKFFEE